MNTNDAQTNLRLTAREIEIIRTTARRLLGAHALIRVFGSRARQDEKGGDIDLLVETDERQPNRVASACRLASELQMQLGGQRIDVLIIDPATREQPIHQIARQTGIAL